MSEVAAKIAPTILVFLLGFLLKRGGVLKQDDGQSLLKVFYYVSVPALIFLSVLRMQFTSQLLWLPLVAPLVILGNFIIARWSGKLLRLEKPSLGVFMVGSLIMNTGVVFPFLLELTGEEGLAQGALFDFGNTALIFTFIYWLACRYGANSVADVRMMWKFLASPPLLALVLGLAMNLLHVELSPMPVRFLSTTGYMSMPLVMLTLGIYFDPKPYKVLPVFSAVFIRMAVGLMLGFLFVFLFDLKGLSRGVVLACSSAPVGVTTLVFSSMEKLDNEFAASVVSYSLIVSFFLIPYLLQTYAY